MSKNNQNQPKEIKTPQEVLTDLKNTITEEWEALKERIQDSRGK